MDGFVGADIEQLRDMATSLDGEAERLSSALEIVTRQVGEVPWFGPSSEMFQDEWHERHRPAAVLAAAALSDLAEKLRANADAQERTSADLGGAAVGGAAVGGTVAGVSAATATGQPGYQLAAASTDAGRDRGDDTADAPAPAPPPMGPFAPGARPGEAGGPGYVIGPPTKPDITWDDDFEYGSADPGFGDYVDWNTWGLKEKAAHLHPGLQDAADFYSHYRDNTGLPKEFDYEEAYGDDDNVRQLVDNEIARTQQGVDELIASGANGEFSVTGDAHATSDDNLYPSTENWQKTIGGYQQWSSADVKVEGNQATMTVTVHAEDYYNFNAGDEDIASGTPDTVNGRFTELGWAKPFESHGQVTRVVTWTVGDPGSVQVAEPEGGR
ncbi:type VII secretion target [Promicromonospora sukumoe]|uniref:type VII secretion target n=1 Tax=Promicromonospora sukumoe TaxID=88382 RepID=UPI0012FB6D43|nr:type VII secretion target [Promicromonospora sukumoe]